MFSHPALFSSEIRGDSEGKALLSEKNISTVSGIDRPYGIIFGEMAYVSVVFVNIGAGMQAFDKVGTVSENVKNVLTGSGHNKHIENDINRIGKLYTDFGKFRFRNTHRIGNNVHCSTLHRAFKKLSELFIALGGGHPIVDISRILFLFRTDEGSVFDSGNVVNCGSVKIAVRVKLGVKLDQLSSRNCLLAECFCLFFASVNPHDSVRLCHFSHLVYPIKNMNIFSHK